MPYEKEIIEVVFPVSYREKSNSSYFSRNNTYKVTGRFGKIGYCDLTKYEYRRGFGRVANNSTKFYGLFKLTGRSSPLAHKDDAQIEAFKDGKPFDLIEYWRKKEPDYPADKIYYRLDLPNEMRWSYKMFRELVSNTSMNQKLTLSLDHSLILKQRKKERTICDFRYKRGEIGSLEVKVKLIDYKIQKQFYWVYREEGVVDRESINKDLYGIIKNEYYCYHVDEKKLKEVSQPDTAKITYKTSSEPYKVGKKTVKKVIQALQRIEGIEVWETGENSIADIEYKWDLIVKLNDKCYPIQVKSNSTNTWEALEYYWVLRGMERIPFVPIIIWAEHNAFIDDIARDFQKLLGLPESTLKPRNNNFEADTELTIDPEDPEYLEFVENFTGL